MGVPTSEDGYSSATAERGDHEVHKEHGVVLGKTDVNVVEYLHINRFQCVSFPRYRTLHGKQEVTKVTLGLALIILRCLGYCYCFVPILLDCYTVTDISTAAD
jgi:hypothetical protein